MALRTLAQLVSDIAAIDALITSSITTNGTNNVTAAIMRTMLSSMNTLATHLKDSYRHGNENVVLSFGKRIILKGSGNSDLANPQDGDFSLSITSSGIYQIEKRVSSAWQIVSAVPDTASLP
jgi:hypothetical protein